MDAEAWRGRDVFVTGHTGFKGAWLCVLLDRLGARVHGYALDTPAHFLFSRAGVPDLLASDTRADIRDQEQVSRALAESGADVVLHLAAQSVVRESYREPRENFAVNVDGTVSVVLAAQGDERVRSCVVVTTDKVYRNEERVRGYREDEPLGGDDPYSASKACTEIVTHSLAVSFPRDGFGLATARAGNVVGGGDATADALIPELVESFASGRPAVLRNPDAVRPWQHVLEPLSGYLTLAEHLPARHDTGFNFGPDDADALTVGAVADLMAGFWGDGAAWETTPDQGPHEAGLLMLDSARAREQLAWTPRFGARDALRLTVEWERAVRAGGSPLDVCRAQVEEFLAG
jgi:CDP-glucose 4,6-dehydratase